jgi:hypothetical protein
MSDYFFCLTRIIARYYLERGHAPNDAFAISKATWRGDEENQ